MQRPLALILVSLAACSGGAAPASTAATTHATLGGDTVALVGSVPIPSSLVGRVAGARSLAPKEALDRLVDDALAAQGAVADGLDRAPGPAWTVRSVLARATVDRIIADARAAPLTDAEIADASAERWREVDVPPQVRVVHAIVRRPSGKDPAKDEQARAIAAKLAAALPGATTAEDFESRANAVPHAGFEILAQALPPFVADGRVTEGPEGAMDKTFAAAAFALKSPGDTSGVVETPFGWHVIRLLERLPARVVPLADRPAILRDGIVNHRIHVALEARKAAGKSEVLPDADALMASISTEGAPSAPPEASAPESP